MVTARQTFGSSSESLAARHLKKRGYTILERNYRNKLGEIDIIARHKGSVVFVEVKARKSARFGAPKLAVTREKQRKISKTALQYLKITNQFRVKARFDVVSIRFLSDEPEIEIIENAFDLAYP